MLSKQTAPRPHRICQAHITNFVAAKQPLLSPAPAAVRCYSCACVSPKAHIAASMAHDPRFDELGTAMGCVWQFMSAGELWQGPRAVSRRVHQSVLQVSQHARSADSFARTSSTVTFIFLLLGFLGSGGDVGQRLGGSPAVRLQRNCGVASQLTHLLAGARPRATQPIFLTMLGSATVSLREYCRGTCVWLGSRVCFLQDLSRC